MIKSYRHKQKRVDFIKQENWERNNNVFTILVGKNGTGKSTLLSAVVRELLGSQANALYGNSELGFEDYRKVSFDIDYPVEMVIAVSTSPFDKFPLNRRLAELAG